MGLLDRIYHQIEALPRLYWFAHEQWEHARYLYEGRQFDHPLELDTTSVLDRAQLGDRSSRSYVATCPSVFRRAMALLTDPAGLAVEPERCDFVDLGSGKGRVVLLAADYPFRSITGVELDPDLHHIAEHNVELYAMQTGSQAPITLLNCDARDYHFSKSTQVVYLYDPFDERAMMPVVANLARVLRRSHCVAYVIYHQPIAREVLRSRADVETLAHDPEADCTIYCIGRRGVAH